MNMLLHCVSMQLRNCKTECKIPIFETEKSEFVERFPELSLFFKACRALYDEMICIFPYFCPCEIIVREIREISF